MKRDIKGPLNHPQPVAISARSSIVGEIQNRSAHLLAERGDLELPADRSGTGYCTVGWGRSGKQKPAPTRPVATPNHRALRVELLSQDSNAKINPSAAVSRASSSSSSSCE
ncbi:hypothetical protein Ahy_A02g008834 isoform B [Arachis hypogaea]|uniref:Uncharacterized protein n=1 Tax=Arachis hypogaea TaxID=3818 RepID=A0A445EG21_ARAHY|nr:hypothetical protein Ahy_A02g008834 isoform B [Arachis hypogaea]